MFVRKTLSAAVLMGALIISSLARADVQTLQQSFNQPPDDARIMVRWWWFGPSVTKPQLEREMNIMRDAGIGGFEVQPTYPLALDDERPGLKNLKLMSPEFLEMLKFTAAKAKELGLRMDLTLGSGWPYGGPQFSEKESTGALVTQVVQVPAGQKSIALPELAPSQEVMAAFVGKGNSGLGARGGGGGGARGGRGGGPVIELGADASSLKPATIASGQVQIPADAPNPAEVVFFISGQTGMGGARGMQVKRPSLGGEGPVIDHFSPPVIEKFIKEMAEPAIAACAPNFPYAVFCDSLEVTGENWTPNMLAEFKKRRGYDLGPLLPGLIGDIGPKTGEIRHDWLMTCTEMFNEYFNTRFQKLANKYGSKYRIQGYGSPPAALYSYAYCDLPEGEGHTWQGFSTSRWAASASHLLGKPVTSSETFTWLHSPSFRATPLDFKAEADRHFLEGINQIIVHGWPYTSEGAAYPGWSFYAATALNQNNPWWIVMPDLSKYLQRVTHVLRQGTPANDVLVYMANSDAWASRATSINGALGGRSGALARAALEAGYNVDFFDDQLLEMRGKVQGNTIAFGDSKYRVVAIPTAQRVPAATMKKLEEFAKAGGIVVAVGNPPEIAPGYTTPESDTKAVRDVSQRLFKDTGATGILLQNDGEFGAAVSKRLKPDVTLTPAMADIGFVHRHTDDAEIYFIANTSNQPQNVKAAFRVEGMKAEQWDPMTGKATAATTDGAGVDLKLPAYGSTVVVFSKRTLPAAPAMAASSAAAPIDLSTGWTVKLGKDAQPIAMEKLVSWADDEKNRSFSGVATYEKKINVPADLARPGSAVSLSFGQATVQQAAGGGRGGGAAQRFRAAIDAPVREACVVYLNDQRVGSLWCPPYSLDVTGKLKAGENQLRVEVANTAINSMAATGYPNYNFQGVRQAFGPRFDPQDLQNLAPLPSGLLGPVQLVPGGRDQ